MSYAAYFSNLVRSWVFTFYTLPTTMFTPKSSIMDVRIAGRVGKEMGRFDNRMAAIYPTTPMPVVSPWLRVYTP
ncbi:MAG: hypothetical protein LBH70_10625 [Spirochaetaceae bacterium]|nr:hypothetical protein [Spirochaetaceae bacterium]